MFRFNPPAPRPPAVALPAYVTRAARRRCVKGIADPADVAVVLQDLANAMHAGRVPAIRFARALSTLHPGQLLAGARVLGTPLAWTGYCDVPQIVRDHVDVVATRAREIRVAGNRRRHWAAMDAERAAQDARDGWCLMYA